MASISKVEGRWRALIRRKGHKPISKRFDTKAAAAEWARAIETQIDVGQVPKMASPATIGTLIKKYRELRSTTKPILDTSSEHYVLKQLTRTLGEIRAEALSVDDLLGWATRRKDEGAGPYTVNCDLSKLGTVLRYVGGSLPDVIGTARPKLAYLGLIGGGGMRERRPVEDELARICTWLVENRGQVYSDFVLFSAYTAMRRSEVARIAWSDVDERKRLVLVRDRKDPRRKIGNDQWVPLLGESWNVMQRQPSKQAIGVAQEDQRIFPIHPQTISKYFKDACRELGVPDLHLHDMRHEGTSRLFEEGFEIQEVALVTGHKDWRHLRRYTQLKPESLHLKVGKQRG
ncbi:tyrosine-type recombinase/integrase [Xylophilus rhododendri]|uniref:Tyrosine-type recombinase/integrase n=1 Tax=Xylophilus rhododendri TaxID=2697032 RepID=A0A857J7X7_9BURK|nr:site-specific integrase [Xylophilus rhododendri]QHI99333.1 tyrosine-type recombinase/integrase [Xylophilus rhododendri]